MSDRIEREIEEILAKLDEDSPPRHERAPISILSHRGKAKSKAKSNSRPAPTRGPHRSLQLPHLTPATLLLTGAGLVIGGLLASNFWSPLIWVSFAGVLLFLGAFGWSFVRSPRPMAGGKGPDGYYWRDRYIRYDDPAPSSWDRVKRRFRR